jgi:hypothetical protein
VLYTRLYIRVMDQWRTRILNTVRQGEVVARGKSKAEGSAYSDSDNADQFYVANTGIAPSDSSRPVQMILRPYFDKAKKGGVGSDIQTRALHSPRNPCCTYRISSLSKTLQSSTLH